MALFELLLTRAGAFCAEQAYHRVTHTIPKADFLRYEPRYLVDCYRDENGIVGPSLPYLELERLLGNSWAEFQSAAARLSVERVAKPFELAGTPPPELSDFQDRALAQFKSEGKLDHDGPVVRLDAYDSERKTLRVQ